MALTAMHSILKIACFLTVAILFVLAVNHTRQGHDIEQSSVWSQQVLAPAPKPASLWALQGKRSMLLTSWLFRSQHRQVQGAHAPMFSMNIKASALDPASVTAQAATCDVLGLNGGPGNYNRVRLSCSVLVHACRLKPCSKLITWFMPTVLCFHIKSVQKSCA